MEMEEIRTVRGWVLIKFGTQTGFLSFQAGHQLSVPDVISEPEQVLSLRKRELPGCIFLGKCQGAETCNVTWVSY